MGAAVENLRNLQPLHIMPKILAIVLKSSLLREESLKEFECIWLALSRFDNFRGYRLLYARKVPSLWFVPIISRSRHTIHIKSSH
jgi:hypothetical protein